MKQTIVTGNAPKAIGPYSQAVVYGGLAYLSGQIAIDPASNKVIEGGISAQTERVLENIKAVLEACGASIDSVLKLCVSKSLAAKLSLYKSSPLLFFTWNDIFL